jgi:HSP20 family protein
MANIIRRNDDRGMSTQQGMQGWDPFRLMREMMGWDPFRALDYGGSAGLSSFMPQFEVKETGDGYVIKADLPGVEEKDVDISLTGNRLTISGRREAEKEDEASTYYMYERSFGTFARSFTLPEGIDGDNVEADLKNGVLTVQLSKRPEVKPRKISVKGLVEKVKGLGGGGEKGKA